MRCGAPGPSASLTFDSTATRPTAYRPARATCAIWPSSRPSARASAKSSTSPRSTRGWRATKRRSTMPRGAPFSCWTQRRRRAQNASCSAAHWGCSRECRRNFGSTKPGGPARRPNSTTCAPGWPNWARARWCARRGFRQSACASAASLTIRPSHRSRSIRSGCTPMTPSRRCKRP